MTNSVTKKQDASYIYDLKKKLFLLDFSSQKKKVLKLGRKTK